MVTAFARLCANRVNLVATDRQADRQTIFSGSRTVDQKRQFTYSTVPLLLTKRSDTF